MDKSILPECMSVHHVCAQYPRRPEGDMFSGARVIDGGELPYAGWQSNLDLLEQQQMFLIP